MQSHEWLQGSIPKRAKCAVIKLPDAIISIQREGLLEAYSQKGFLLHIASIAGFWGRFKTYMA